MIHKKVLDWWHKKWCCNKICTEIGQGLLDVGNWFFISSTCFRWSMKAGVIHRPQEHWAPAQLYWPSLDIHFGQSIRPSTSPSSRFPIHSIGSIKYDEHCILDAASEANKGLSGWLAVMVVVGALVTLSSPLRLVYEKANCPLPGACSRTCSNSTNLRLL